MPVLGQTPPQKPGESPFKNEAKCTSGKGEARPLIVEWPSSDRAELEARAKGGVVPVHWVGCEMQVLTRCKAPGAYGYTAITRKTDHITMRNADEIYANIPVYAAKFEGKLASAGSLDVAMTIVGRYEANKPLIRSDELQGDCGAATHVITAVTVGAFEFSAGTSAEAGAGANVLGAGAGAQTKNEKETLNKDGDKNDCEKASADDKTPPFGCGALLRLEVVPLGEAKQAEPSCPAGTKWDQNQCVALSAPPPPRKQETWTPPQRECATADACDVECKAGKSKSCMLEGVMVRDGKSSSKDPARAATLFQGACDAGELKACAYLGEQNYQGNGVAKDPKAALALFQKGCDGGEAYACVDLARQTADGVGVKKDEAAAAALFAKGCTGSMTFGCVGLAFLHREGRGVAKDPKRAQELFKKACDAGDQFACKQAQ